MRWMIAASLVLAAAAAGASERHPFGFDDMAKLHRISDPQPSPDGRWITFTAGLPDLKKNKVVKDIWIVPSGGGAARRLTNGEGQSYGARWSPDSRGIAFIAVRGGSAGIWTMAPSGGGTRQIRLPVDADNAQFSPDGIWLAFTAEVYPDCGDLSCTAARDKAKGADPVKARAYDGLLFRHWDQWEDGKRSHLFLMPSQGGAPRDLTPGMDADVPTKPFGGMEEIAFSPDSSRIAFTAKLSKDPAWNTDTNIFEVEIATGERRCLSCPNEAADAGPAYSPDGRSLAWLAMERPGYESDRLRIAIHDRASGKLRILTEGWDRSPKAIAWAPDGKTIFATAEEMGRQKIFAVDAANGAARAIVTDGFSDGLAIAKGTLVFTQDGFTSPAEVHACRHDGGDLKQLTHMNDAVMASVIMSEPEEFTFKGAMGEAVQGWLFKPVGFRDGASYPLTYFIHGGPQNAWLDHFHYRWNIEIAPGRGFAAAAVNFHGSTGFGQKFTDSIRGRWGELPYEDLMKGLDRLLADNPWIDRKRACALGASFGGYMVNWINGKNGRFACLVTHDGDFSTLSSYYNTDELWFPEWDMGGTPFDDPKAYERWSPDRLVGNWKTPTLVIHGANDFRVVESEGMSTFTALVRRGIPARFVHFPDENHWVSKPANSRRWHEEVYGWIERWTGPAPMMPH